MYSGLEDLTEVTKAIGSGAITALSLLPTPLLALGISLFFLLAAGLYWLFFVPYFKYRDLTDVGYSHLKGECQKRGLRLKDLINQIKYCRKVGNIPPLYPNGWIPLIESRDLKIGEAKSVSAVGETFAVFRDEGGEIHILDAYCPHLGANLGVGGRVQGNCIQCPFHGWKFRGSDGKCVGIPYASKVPEFASTKVWKSFEANGFIFVWFHAEGDQPTWFPPKIEEIDNGCWIYRGGTEHRINAHIQEIPENGGDMSHFNVLHAPALMAGGDVRKIHNSFWDFVQHYWQATWKENDPPDLHIATVNITHSVKLFSKISLFTFDITARQIGPALVHLHLSTPLGRGVLIQSVTPMSPMETVVSHHLYTERSVVGPISKILILGEIMMFERDIMMWNHKTYKNKPLLVKEDKLILGHRRWYSQFYTENSPRMQLDHKPTCDW